jgi:hypothetical protein
VNHRELFDDLRETVFKTVAFVRSAILPARSVGDRRGLCITMKTVDPATDQGCTATPPAAPRLRL